MSIAKRSEPELQEMEPVIRPSWNTFASSVSGIWKGVGAVFSPSTAEMEPIEIGGKNENLYDCYTLSRIEAAPSLFGEGRTSQIRREINWVTLNPHGDVSQPIGGSNGSKNEHKDENASLPVNQADTGLRNHILPAFESFDFETSALMEEDVMGNESGLVFFEYLVKGCHERLRTVHAIEFNNGGLDIQIMRVDVYEEEWVSPANLPVQRDLEFVLMPFSQRKRTKTSELTGSWKAFEVSATPVFGEEMASDDSNGAPYVYLCTETLKKWNLPKNPVYFGEEEILDMQDLTVLRLPGGVTGYVDVNKDGTFSNGVGWYSDEGINLVMERDYGVDGKLKEVRWKSEVEEVV